MINSHDIGLSLAIELLKPALDGGVEPGSCQMGGHSERLE